MAETEVKSIFDTESDEAEEARLDAKADAKVEAGLFVSDAEVAKWLQSWGTPNKLPRSGPDTV
jgi:predicted transcriptional regulator